MSRESRITHVAFSDESYWNIGRYRALGLVTMPYENVTELEEEIRTLLNDSGLSEFKWKRLSGARERFAALKLCEFTVEAVCQGKLRVDVLTWDIEDSRHKVPRRDDVGNLQRMYYHLFKYVLRNCWPDGSVWALYPDESNTMDWDNVKDFLDRVDTEIELYQDLFRGGKFKLRLIREFQVYEIKPVSSDSYPFTQIADLFGGLSVFSRVHYDKFDEWLTKQEGSLFSLKVGDELDGIARMSKSMQERCCVLARFDTLCKSRKLGVSLKTRRGLWTPDPKNPINFWPYTPQHPLDKAPTKR